MSKKRILVLYTGGTFGMDESLKIPNLSAKALKDRLTKQVPEMAVLAHCDVEVIFNLDSCQMNSTHWFILANRIAKAAKSEASRGPHYDGCVILHGTDTLAYTASALSILLSPTPFPVVLTGAQRPLATLRNDARNNFISALEVAASAPPALKHRVLVAFHDDVFLGSRIRKKSALDFAAFESPRFPILATIGSRIQYTDALYALPKLSAKTAAKKTLLGSKAQAFPTILHAELAPNFPAQVFTNELLQGLDGIVLTLYTSGTAPTLDPEFIHFLKRAKNASTPIYAITEREHAPAKLSTYGAGIDLEDEGVIWCGDLTPESAYVKAGLLRLLHSKLTRSEYFRSLPKLWRVAIADESA